MSHRKSLSNEFQASGRLQNNAEVSSASRNLKQASIHSKSTSVLNPFAKRHAQEASTSKLPWASPFAQNNNERIQASNQVRENVFAPAALTRPQSPALATEFRNLRRE